MPGRTADQAQFAEFEKMGRLEPALESYRRAVALADDIARKIEGELQYPGQIKVVVIRETRAVNIAR